MPSRRCALSVVIPTRGRATLVQTLASLRQQPGGAQLDLIVVGDTYRDDFADALAPVPALCATYAARYLPHDGGVHAWGHPQRTAGAGVAQGEWVWWLQDDTVATRHAVADIRQRTGRDAAPVPILFRVQTWQAGLIWRQPQVLLGNVDADCIVVPNRPACYGAWTPVYEGDYHFIRDTVAQWPGRPRWAAPVIAIGRPERASWATQDLDPTVLAL